MEDNDRVHIRNDYRSLDYNMAGNIFGKKMAKRKEIPIDLMKYAIYILGFIIGILLVAIISRIIGEIIK